MITLNELKNAVSKISDAEIITGVDDEKKGRFKFKRNNDNFTIHTMPDNGLSKANLRLSRLVGLSNSKEITKEEGELIEASMNLLSETPCKITYLYDDEEAKVDGRFFITNIYTDKLNHFDKFGSEEVKTSNLVVLILSMMFETVLCTQEILTQVEDVMKARSKVGVHHGE